jgi:soluble lytic murein transglycosylase
MITRLIVVIAVLTTACGSSNEATAAGEVTATSGADAANEIAQNDALKAAQAAIDAGHPWRATQLVTPLIRDAAKTTPAAVLVAARAAAQWEGWAEVDRLLAGQTWIDTRFDGEGRELLTRSALERGVDSAALTQALAGVRTATAGARPVRLVLLARALERNNHFDSAAVVYTRAAESLRPIRDWLHLRAAGSIADSAKRAKALNTITLAVAKPRIPWTDAQARERFGDAVGSAALYAKLGAPVTAFRLRLSVAPDSVTREAVKNEVVAFLRTKPVTADARAAVEVLDKAFPSLSPADELTIARAIASGGPPARAVAAFERASALLTPNDRLAYAQALSRAGRSRDAIAQLASIQGPLAAQASYQRARVLLTSGTADATKAALRDVVAKFPTDSDAASAALYLLADLATDAADDEQAQTLYRQLYRDYPTSARAPLARFHAGVIAFVAGDHKTAAQSFDSLLTLAPRADDAIAARYWSGRAWERAGNSELAKTRWREVIDQHPLSYYAVVASKRLNDRAWSPPAGGDSVARIAAIDSAFARAALLERLGMDVEARFEYEALDDAAASSPDRVVATAHAFLDHGQASRAIRLAQKAADAGRRDAAVYRVLFPIVDGDELARAARANGLDPALVAGLIRQESSFNPRALSVANARGLMQVLPSVGEEVARSLRFPTWSPALLYDADANLQLGTAHLAAAMKQYGALPRVLAAYNAGGSRVQRWSTKRGMDDPELFVERIPFVETRDYVRIVQRNAAIYSSLYGEALGTRRQAPGAR